MRLNETAYEEYSPVYLPISFALTYLLAFMVPPAILVQTIMVFGPEVYQRLRGRQSALSAPEDVHAKLMRRYHQVPWWWYGVVFVISVSLAFGSTRVQHDLAITIPAILLAIVSTMIWIVPVCYISAISGQTAAINLIAHFIPGALWRQNPFANMVFKSYCVGGLAVGMTFVRGLKLGRYMKIPPKYTFMVQAAEVVLATITEALVKEWIFAGGQDVCDKVQPAKLSRWYS
ncbi:hypothetical protein FS837_012268 [Tulasnella sp. UAMH 9824]|nr:hypothetical protein FS837_012268 [Tulasnella sp. UAMH 9824]